jgi:hypothetical protein
MAATKQLPHTNPFTSDPAAIGAGWLRSKRITIATSEAGPHQYADDTAGEIVSLHSRLHPENARKSKTHRTSARRNAASVSPDVEPITDKATKLSKEKVKANVAAAATWGSTPTRRIKNTAAMTRKEKKKPTQNARDALFDGCGGGIAIALRSVVIALSEN